MQNKLVQQKAELIFVKTDYYLRRKIKREAFEPLSIERKIRVTSNLILKITFD